jgi:tRNA(adenine34) deaminase
MAENDEKWMDRALELARASESSGNTPVASVVARDGVMLGEGPNYARTKRDPILHAEIVAIQAACKATNSMTLEGATLYTTMEPCPMCAWGIQCAGIKRVVLGARHADLQRTDLGTYAFETFMSGMMKSDVQLVTGVRNAECVALRKAWIAKTGRFA